MIDNKGEKIYTFIKIGIFVCFLRIRLYITKTDNH